MSTRNNQLDILQESSVFACADSGYVQDVQTVSPSSARDLFTHQTGQALITLGQVFNNVPPFNDHIDRNTGKLLISLGKKLKKK